MEKNPDAFGLYQADSDSDRWVT